MLYPSAGSRTVLCPATFPLDIRVATTCPLQRQSQLITFKLDAHRPGSTPGLADFPCNGNVGVPIPPRHDNCGGLPRLSEVTCSFPVQFETTRGGCWWEARWFSGSVSRRKC